MSGTWILKVITWDCFDHKICHGDHLVEETLNLSQKCQHLLIFFPLSWFWQMITQRNSNYLGVLIGDVPGNRICHPGHLWASLPHVATFRKGENESFGVFFLFYYTVVGRWFWFKGVNQALISSPISPPNASCFWETGKVGFEAVSPAGGPPASGLTDPISLNHQMEGTEHHTCYHVGGPWGHDAEWETPDTEGH